MSYTLGQVTVDQLTLVSISTGREQDISGQAVVLSLYEDIMSPSIVVEVTVLDGIGLLRTFPIVGSEWLDVQFTTPGRQGYKVRLQVYEVNNISTNDNQTAYSYTIRAISEEAVASAAQHIERAYKDPIDATVKDILTTNLKTKKTLFYEQTKGPQHIVFPRKTPFAAIEILRRRAVSQTRPSATYLFFENRYGYNFQTLEEIAEKNKGAIGDKIWTRYNILNDVNQNALGFHAILSYSIGRQFNMINSIAAGGLYNVHESYDMIKKSIKTTEYRLEQFNEFAQPEDNGVSPFTPEIYNKYGKTTQRRMFNIGDSSRPDTYLNDTQGKRLGYNAIHHNNQVTIHSYGDSSVSVGDVVTVDIKKTESTTKKVVQPEPLAAGNYIVGQAHHCIQFSSGKPLHTLTFTAIRGTYTEI